MRILFRVDSSLVIGTGHVMRCLMLARALREGGAECRFVSADLPGHLVDLVRERGFQVALVPAPDAAADPRDYKSWTGLSLEADVAATLAAQEGFTPDWIVIDHYGLDAAWQDAVAVGGTRVLAIDDLANRPHRADLLVDPNLGRQAQDYTDLVPNDCQLCVGPRYAMLRPEFATLREDALASRPGRMLRHILITMGGVDLHDATSAILERLAAIALPADAEITVVMGRSAPHLGRVRALAAASPVPCHVLTDVPDMHNLMAAADLAIGAIGGTAWERCALGLPSLMLAIAENQVPGAQALARAEAAIYLGRLNDADWRENLSFEIARMSDPAALFRLSSTSAEICDGLGTTRLAQALQAFPD